MSPRRKEPAGTPVDPIPDDLTPEERQAVIRQGELIAERRADGRPWIGRRGEDFDFGD